MTSYRNAAQVNAAKVIEDAVVKHCSNASLDTIKEAIAVAMDAAGYRSPDMDDDILTEVLWRLAK